MKMKAVTSDGIKAIVADIVSVPRVAKPEELLLVMKYSDDGLPPNQLALHTALACIGFGMGEHDPIDAKGTLEWCKGVTDCLNCENRWGIDHPLTKSTRANLFMLSLNLLNRWFTSSNALTLIELARAYFPLSNTHPSRHK
jgi:hypothetical protein